MESQPKDINGNTVRNGARVRLLNVSGDCLDELPPDEKRDVLSMIGEVFEVDEMDEYGRPCISKWFPGREGTCVSHSIALDPHEMELVDEQML
jgi:hypothetical protein